MRKRGLGGHDGYLSVGVARRLDQRGMDALQARAVRQVQEAGVQHKGFALAVDQVAAIDAAEGAGRRRGSDRGGAFMVGFPFRAGPVYRRPCPVVC